MIVEFHISRIMGLKSSYTFKSKRKVTKVKFFIEINGFFVVELKSTPESEPLQNTTPSSESEQKIVSSPQPDS